MTKTRSIRFRKRRRGGRKTLKRRGGKRRSRVTKRRGGRRRSRVAKRSRGGNASYPLCPSGWKDTGFVSQKCPHWCVKGNQGACSQAI